ncbi:UxaA family hydrolase [Halorussus sp. AFM4]|uniref:UxaA family hydrolase n=1 Tax=Halorussus sp. AFM4 TaxID=3421651 RepID=UPI003EBB5960
MKGIVLDDAALLMTRSDNVATTLEDLDAGQTVEYEGDTITLTEAVSFGHKFALADIPEDETIRKYGEVIGQASQDIATGEWVHTHNCESRRGRGDLEGQNDD